MMRTREYIKEDENLRNSIKTTGEDKWLESETSIQDWSCS